MECSSVVTEQSCLRPKRKPPAVPGVIETTLGWLPVTYLRAAHLCNCLPTPFRHCRNQGKRGLQRHIGDIDQADPLCGSTGVVTYSMMRLHTNSSDKSVCRPPVRPGGFFLALTLQHHKMVLVKSKYDPVKINVGRPSTT